MPTNNPSVGIDRRRQLAIVWVVLLILCVGYALAVHGGAVSHFDHSQYLRTLEYQRDGMGYYDAYLRAFSDEGVVLSEVRAVRQPALFLLWGEIPERLLWPLFAIGVVGGTSVLLTMIARSPAAVLPVAAYLLLAGRIPPEPAVDQWMLVELWTLPLLAGSLVLWTRERDGASATLAAAAVLVRELAVCYLAVATITAWLRRGNRARAWWTSACAGALGGYAVHAAVVSPRLADKGNDATILGTGDAPRTVWEMVAWMVPGPAVVGIVVVGCGLLHLLLHRRDLAPLVGLFALAGTGIFVARPYWGFLFIPFGILLFGDAVGRLWHGGATPLQQRASRLGRDYRVRWCRVFQRRSATGSGSQDRALSSSSVAALTFRIEPSSFKRRLRRVGPSPGTSSSTDWVIRLSRRVRW